MVVAPVVPPPPPAGQVAFVRSVPAEGRRTPQGGPHITPHTHTQARGFVVLLLSPSLAPSPLSPVPRHRSRQLPAEIIAPRNRHFSARVLGEQRNPTSRGEGTHGADTIEPGSQDGGESGVGVAQEDETAFQAR